MNKKIIRICEQKFIYLNYSPRTKDNYLIHIKDFLKSIGDKQVIHCNSKDFQSYLDNYPFSSVSQQNQVINAIRFLYKYGLNKKYDKVSFKRPKSEKKLPQVIDHSYIIAQLDKVQNLKHKSILTLAYSVGLRVSEIINLRIEDIDSKRMLIYIKNAKGRKDRIVPLSQNLLHLLREYYKTYRPDGYLFNGQTKNKYSSTSCNNIVIKHKNYSSLLNLLRTCLILCKSSDDISLYSLVSGFVDNKFNIQVSANANICFLLYFFSSIASIIFTIL